VTAARKDLLHPFHVLAPLEQAVRLADQVVRRRAFVDLFAKRAANRATSRGIWPTILTPDNLKEPAF